MKLKMSKEVDLGKEPIGHLLLILALPSITSQVVNALYNMVDRMYIGHIPEIGSAALTGVGVCFPLIMIISAFAYLLGMGGAPRASICMGRKDNKGAEKIMGNCFSSLIIVSIILTAVVLIFQDPLLYLFGASENTIGYAKEYITIYAIGTIFVQLTLGMNSFISAQGFSTISMMTVCIGAVTNIILDPIFIFVFNMGVAGAAWATIISQALSALWAVWFLSKGKSILRLKKENLRIDMKVLAPCIALGVAPFAMQATESVLVLCFNSSLLRYGGRRRHDHPFQRDAVRDAAAAGPDPGRPADHQLQLRRHAGTARQKGIPPADHRLLHLLILAVGRRGTVPIIVRRHLYQ